MLRISVKAVIILTGIISSLISLGAGMLMYQASIDALFKTTEDSTRESTRVVLRVLRLSFDNTQEAVSRTQLMFQDYTPTGENPEKDLTTAFHKYAFSQIRYSPTVYAVGMRMPSESCSGCLPSSKNKTYARCSVWYDPVVQNGSVVRQYMTGYTYTNMTGGHAIFNETGTEEQDHVVSAFVLNPSTGDVSTTEPHFTYRDNVDTVTSDILQSKDGQWVGPAFWAVKENEDLIPYMYMTYRVSFRMHHFKRDILAVGFFVYSSWVAELNNHGGGSIDMIVANLTNGDERVMAHSYYTGYLVNPEVEHCVSFCSNCEATSLECSVRAASLGPTVASAVNVMRNVDRNIFFTSSLPSTNERVLHIGLKGVKENTTIVRDGGQYFLLRQEIFSYKGQTEEVITIDLLWMRPVAEVDGDVKRAMVQLLICVAAILFIDMVIAGFELLVVASPLRRLQGVARCFDTFDLDGAEVHLHHTVTAITEINSVVEALRVSLASMQQYKRFLPSFVDYDTSLDGRSLLAPPVGKSAVVLTSIQDSEVLWQAAPADMAEAVKLHSELMRISITIHSGYEVKTVGEAFMIVFEDVNDSVSFCLDVQRKLMQLAWPDGFQHSELTRAQCDANGTTLWNGLRVSMGIYYGDIEPQSNELTKRVDYTGPAVKMAAQIESQSRGGTVLCHASLMQRLSIGDINDEIDISDVTCLVGDADQESVVCILSKDLSKRKNVYIEPQRNLYGLPTNPLTAHLRDNTIEYNEEYNDNYNNDGPRKALRTQVKATMGSIAHVQLHDGRMDVGPEGSAERVAGKYNTLFEVLLRAANQVEGFVQSANGDCMVVTWNLNSTRSIMHRLQAFRFASLLVSPERGVLSLGIATGKMWSGNVGKRKRYVVNIGYPVALANAMSLFCAQSGCSVLTSVYSIQSSPAPYLRTIDVWGDPTGQPIHIQEVVLPKFSNTSIWTLSLNEQQVNHGDEEYEAHFKNCLKGDVTALESLHRMQLQEINDRVLALVLCRLEVFLKPGSNGASEDRTGYRILAPCNSMDDAPVGSVPFSTTVSSDLQSSSLGNPCLL